MNRVNLLGFDIDTFSKNEAIEFAKNLNGQVVTINPEIIESANKNQDLAKVINSAELVIPDGIGVKIGLKILGHNVERIAGIEFAKNMLQELKGQPVALLGAKPEVIELAVQKLKNEISDINIVYWHDGYFTNEDDIIKEVVGCSPRLVLVAMGSPKQEFLISKLKSKLPNALLIGVGGSFDVWAGVVQRAPILFQKLGLEWFYRTIKEPSRFKRIFPTLPLFVLNVLKTELLNVIKK